MRIIKWLSENILLSVTLFLLAFIPLYPKLPIIGVDRTWVYIRLEDFFVAFTALLWVIQLIRKKAQISTPLTFSIFFFWAIGAISTAYALIFLFPNLADVFPHIAILHYLRRIEYLILFFVAFSAIKDKKDISYVITALVITLLLVVGYGTGQRLYPNIFHAYLTMNEEFAKGIPLTLSAAARIPSTFSGHYDLAAYLVLMIPLLGSMVFGYKKIYVKIFFVFTTISGLSILLLTASRVSFVVYLMGMAFMLILQKQKKFIIPVIILSILFSNFFQGISQRFGNTISQADVVVDARTGKTIGIVKKVSESKKQSTKTAEKKKSVVIEDVQSTGENLPQGSGYINLPAQPVGKTITEVIYKRAALKEGTLSAQLTNLEGSFVVKKVLAYDVSFTTRFQGEWPRAIEAFKRNIFLGSGYSSISLATDNNYLRMLGETGVLGFSAYLFIFLIFGIYVKNILPFITSSPSHSFVLGVSAGIFGLALNAALIDVFEASKVALVLWMLIGITVGICYQYQKNKINFISELVKFFISTPLLIIYLLIVVFNIFSIIFSNYFVGDDFTWLRWAGDCKKVLYTSGIKSCEPTKTTLEHFFTQANGFFYRPGTKVYFYIMYTIFSLNPLIYHVISVLLHSAASILVFLLSKKILRSKFFGFITALFFIVLSVNSEMVFWVAATGHLVTVACVLLSLLLYIYWKEQKYILYLLFSVISAGLSLLFHEFGIITPLLILSYDLISSSKLSFKNILQSSWIYIIYGSLDMVYLIIRNMAQSHWFSGDYNYNLVKLPYNIVGNIVGYTGVTLFGVNALQFYEQLRQFLKHSLPLAVVGLVVFLAVAYLFYKFGIKKLDKKDRTILYLGIAFFIIPLIPFLGLGNIAIRYSYFGSFGLIFLFVFLLRKSYQYIALSHKLVAIILLVFVLVSFPWFHIKELKRINSDWEKAGKISSKLISTFDLSYVKTLEPNPVFYFVNVPIRYNNAWLFPVGLPDALWFDFQDINLTVHLPKTLDLALDSAEGSASARVFEFNKQGGIEQIIRTKETKTVPNDAK